MEVPDTDSLDLIEQLSEPAFGLITEATLFGETEPHAHSRAQLMYVMAGVFTIAAAGGIWTVPPHCALWIPPGIAHAGKAAGHVKIASLYLDRDVAAPLNDRCEIVFVQPFLRELILHFDSETSLMQMDVDRRQRLLAVLIDELSAAPAEPIHLPMPADRRLRRLTDAMLADPAQRFTVEEWGARVGASPRTLSRLFQRETGLSFGRWRQQLHVGLALQRLAQGDQVTTIATDFGYESVSAFIAMFRRMLGTTPARYFDDVANKRVDRHADNVFSISDSKKPSPLATARRAF